ncbi:MAG: undecaprenyl-diphosphatase UppP [Candidatus Levybacteria bacterium]|nr:undecaprenyl-diphosphatase UppP [Candidatus Levybacteria bacterium]
MSILQAVILAVVEGITEFLPISSTGHLVLTATLLKIQQDEFVKSFEIIIQLGAILGVVMLYFQTLSRNFRLWKALLVAFLPSMVVGLMLYKLVKTVLLGSPYITLLALFLGGILILFLERKYTETPHHTQDLSKITAKQAFLTGLCQSVSIIPGVSRAAATILGGMYVGLSRKTAVEFSFLLAIPTMFAASVLDISQSLPVFTYSTLPVLIVGFVVSFVVAVGSVKWLLSFIRTHSLRPFGVYRIIISIIYYFLIL